MRNNNNVNKEALGSHAPFILIIALFIIVFVVVSYFLVSGSAFGNYYIDNLDINKNINVTKSPTIIENSLNNNKQVYNIRDNIFTYTEAKAVCAAHGARLATLQEMIDSYKKGANWCSYGWADGQLALYPTQKEYWAKLQMDSNRRKQCGEPGLNGGYFENPNFKFGANCYGNKPSPKAGEVEKNQIGRLMHNPYESLVDKYKDGVNNFRISPFNEDKWSN